MLHTNRAKTGTLFIVGIIILLAAVSLYLLRTSQINADDSARSAVIPQTAFPSEVAGEPVLGIFEGITPCSGVDRPLPQIPEDTNCEQMIWKLTLYQDTSTGSPTTYQLMSAYGLSQQGTTGLQGGGTQLNLEGKWTKLRGTKANLNAEVYQLNPDDPQNSINFIKMDDNILHVLTQDKTLMLGNAAWSYTLNRTDKRIVSDPSAAADLATPAAPSLITSEAVNPGVFEGRMPCAETVMALNDISTPGCQRVKLQLTLHQNTETHAPTTYELLTVYVGLGNTQYRTSGTWAVLQGTKTDSEALVYQLNPNDSHQPIFFLRADDHHLFLLDTDFNLMVGDALASFTLNRKS